MYVQYGCTFDTNNMYSTQRMYIDTKDVHSTQRMYISIQRMYIGQRMCIQHKGCIRLHTKGVRSIEGIMYTGYKEFTCDVRMYIRNTYRIYSVYDK
jgi:hypothetical protein